MNEADQWKKKILPNVLASFKVPCYTNMKNYKHIACTDFVNLNIALHLHSYEEH